MWANLGAHLVELGPGKAVVEARAALAFVEG
jgi:hypothetical protein